MKSKDPENCQKLFTLLDELHKDYCRSSQWLYRERDVKRCDEIAETRKSLIHCKNARKT